MANKTVTVRPSGGTYTSLQAAITGEVIANADLTATGMDGILNIEISGSWVSADTTRVDITGFTTDANHYVNIYTDTANRASKRDASKYRLIVAGDWGSPALQITDPYTRAQGFQVSASGGFNTGINCANVAGIVLDSMICYDCPGGADNYPGIRTEGIDIVIVNCISMGNGNDGIRVAGGSAFLYNCDTVNNGASGIFIIAWVSGTVINCYSGGNVNADYVAEEFSTADFNGSYSEDESMLTTLTAYTTSNFTNVTPGSEDLSLVSPLSVLIDDGIDLSDNINYPFTWDINNNERIGGDWGMWSVGAFEAPYYDFILNGNGGLLQDDYLTVPPTPVAELIYPAGREGDSTSIYITPYTIENGYGYIREGYTLTGWNTLANGTGTHYDNSVETSVSTETSDVVLYAEWTAEGPHIYLPGDTLTMSSGGITLYAYWTEV